MLKAKILTLAALLVVLMSNVNVGRAEEEPFGSLEVLWEIQYPGDIFAISPDESLLVTRNKESYGAKTIKVYDLKDGNLLREFPDMVGEDTTRYGLAFLPDNKTIVYACNITYPKGKTRIYRRDIETGIIKDSTFAPDSLYDFAQIRDMQVTPDGKYLIVSIGEAYQTSSVHLFIYDAHNMELVKRIQRINTPFKLKVSPNSQYLSFSEINTDGKTYAVYYYDIYKGTFKIIQYKDKDYNGITDIQFSKDSKKIVFTREHDMIGIYDFEKDSLQKIEMKGTRFRTANFLNDSLLIFSSLVENGHFLLNLKNNEIKIFPFRGSVFFTFLYMEDYIYTGPILTGRITGLTEFISSVIDKNNFQIIYPNPTTQTLTIPNNGIAYPEQIRINNLDGLSIQIQTTDIIIGKNSIQINVGSLQIGSYLLTIQTQNKISSYKFLKN